MKKQRNVVIAGALMALAQVTFAQTAPTPAQMAQQLVQRYTIVLGLSSTVEEQALTIYTTEETTMATIRTTERAAETALLTAIKADNTANIATVSTAIGTLKGQSTKAKATADAEFYALLTTEQQTKFAEILAHGGGGGRGPGGPGGPPPPAM